MKINNFVKEIELYNTYGVLDNRELKRFLSVFISCLSEKEYEKYSEKLLKIITNKEHQINLDKMNKLIIFNEKLENL